jgi:transaldolase
MRSSKSHRNALEALATCRGYEWRRELCTELGGNTMRTTVALHNLGQSLWPDNITRDLLNSGTLQRYIDEFSVTGLTSNPAIFAHAIRNSAAYDEDISRWVLSGKSGEDLFFQLALSDLTRAAELFRYVFVRTDRVDGWVSLEVSPLIAHDTDCV